MNLIDDMLAQSTIELEAEGLGGPISISLDPKAPTSPLVKLLKPKVTIRTGSQVLYSTAPYGQPSKVPWLLIAGGLLSVILLLSWR